MFWKKWFEPKAFDESYLPVVDGHRVFFHQFGNPKGKPVLLFHGGPGGQSRPSHCTGWDLKKYRVIMFDQRGCGRSTPLGQWNNNKTADLIKDADRILRHLKIVDDVILGGASWGATLALKFAETYPKRIDKMVLSQIFLADENSIDWVNKYSGFFYPDLMEKITKDVSKWETIPQYYQDLICSGERKKQSKAISNYMMYEFQLGQLDPKLSSQEVTEENLASGRIYITYASNRYYLKENEILKNIKKIAKIPTLIVHSRLDFSCPLIGAYELHKAMSNSKLIIVPALGHVSKKLYKVKKKAMKKFLQN